MEALNPAISFVVPLYNEEQAFPMLIERLNKVMDASAVPMETVLIDDGSKDNTAQLMQGLALTDARYNCVFLSRNFGHQLALTAGLTQVRATEAIMIIDGDLQDPPELVTDFYKLYKDGYDVIYAIRKGRKEGWLLTRMFSLYYRIQKRLVNIDVPLDSGDFSMVSRRVIDLMNQLPEESRYLRGLRTWLGFKQIGVEYDRPERVDGETKYPLSKRIAIALNGIFNFSEVPVKFITYLGLTTTLIAVLYFAYTLVKKFVFDIPVAEGFTGLLFTIILFSGVQLISLGVIGEYVLRIFFQVKGRPLFVIKQRIVNKKVVD
jgi:polyisoprenyl-phosphate glycosyltransferase